MPTKNITSPEFVAGVLSLSATFFHNNSARTENFGFQVKLAHENRQLLEYIREVVSIKNDIHTFVEGGTKYVLLNTRSKKTLVNYVIPFMDIYLQGPKLVSYQTWRQNLLDSI
jgi:hypothetical protein